MTFTWKEVPEFVVDLYRDLRDEIDEAFEKQAFNALGELGEFLQLFPGKTLGIPSQPGPLASMLVGGLAGAGLGYGAGALGETFLPHSWSRGNLRRSMALAGAGMGATPGLTWGLMNKANSEPFFSYQPGTTPALDSESMRSQPSADFQTHMKKAKDAIAALLPGSGLMGVPAIDVGAFQSMIYEDPRVADRLSPQEQSAAAGLVRAADLLGGNRNSGYVTPMDIGRLAAGMGVGYSAGALVGRVLGTVMGMPEHQQDQLKNIGLMAGLVKQYIPIAFGQ